jgi:hypothetical protein
LTRVTGQEGEQGKDFAVSCIGVLSS